MIRAEEVYITLLKGSNQPKKRKDIITQVKRRIAYSERNRKAKLAPEYSVLKPDTSSDSDSEKSKGARWSSAKEVTNHTKMNKRKIREEELTKERMLNVNAKKTKITKRVVNTDSYLIDCATERKDPIKEYLEFLDQPERRVVKIVILETRKKRRNE